VVLTDEIVARATEVAYDLDLASVRRWKEATGGKVIGHLPVYVPREIIHAATMLPVALLGGGDSLEIIRGDAFFQSYICHIPRSTVELMVSGRYDLIDGFLFPATCDVIRNLSGMWKMMAPEKYTRYLDVPQDHHPELGGRFYESELREICADLAGLAGVPYSAAALDRSIALYDDNRQAVRELYELRAKSPWLAPTSEVYVVLRAGAVLPVEEHTALVRAYLDAAARSGKKPLDMARVVVVGSFCEQPPLGLIKTLERAGCYIVDDDYLLGLRWLGAPVRKAAEGAGGDPLLALVRAYLEDSAVTAIRYIGEDEKGRALVETVRRVHAEGVIFCAASFCDPALLDQPMLVAALGRAGIPATSFKYSEDGGQFGVIREQAGTFADSIKLWSEA
jgi:benzoyl-CoA reductase subunit C